MLDSIALIHVRSGKEVAVVRLLSTENEQLRKLTAFGILPGVRIKVLQRYPAYLLQIGHTELAVDYEIAKNIMVNKV